MSTDSKQMQCFEYAPEEEDQSFSQASARSFMGYQQKSEDVLESVISPSQAFEKFAGKVFSTASVDYTKQGGTNGNLPLTGPNGVIETPLQKYNRLTSELAAFEADLTKIKDPAVGSLLGAEVKELQAVLAATASDAKVSPFLQANYPLGSQAITGKNVGVKLTQEMAEFKRQQEEQKNKTAADEEKVGDKGVMYELYLSNYKTNDLSNLPDIDQRISKLEKTIGSQAETLPACFPDILSGILFLQRKLESFSDPHKREPILRRMKTLTGELEMLQEQKKNLQGAKATEYEDKVKALYELLPVWDNAAQQLPLVLARLQSLKDVTELGKSAGAQLSALEKEQAGTDVSLKEGQAALDKVAASLSQSVQGMQTNVEALEAKFDQVSQKYQK